MYLEEQTVLMIASSSNKLYHNRSGGQKQTSPLDGVKHDIEMFKKKFYRKKLDHIESSRQCKILLTKKFIFNWLVNKFKGTTTDVYIFYSGHGHQNGDWAIQTEQKPKGDVLSLEEIIKLWKESNAHLKYHLYIFMDSCHSAWWCERLSVMPQKQLVSIFASCNKQQKAKDLKDGGLLSRCVFCTDQQYVESHLQLLFHLSMNQTPYFINKMDSPAQLKPQHIQILQSDITKAKIIKPEVVTQLQNNVKRDRKNKIKQLYQKTQMLWNLQISEDTLKQLLINNAHQIFSQSLEGNPKAFFLLGRCYSLGYSFPKNEEFAKQCFIKAQKLGQIHSIYNLYCLQSNLKQENKMLYEGAQRGQFRSICDLVEQYIKYKGPESKTKLQQAFKLVKQLIQYQYVKGYCLACKIHNISKTQYYNPKKGQQYMKFFLSKAKNSQQHKISFGYYLFQFDFYNEAAQVLKDAFNGNKECAAQIQKQNGKVQFRIGFCFQQMKKIEDSKIWHKKAIDKKYLPSFIRLACILRQKSINECISILLYAIDLPNDKYNNLANAYYNLGVCYNKLKDYNIGYKYLQEGVKLGHSNSIANCGYMIYNGDGVQKDKIKGQKMLKQALQKGSQVASKFMRMIQLQQNQVNQENYQNQEDQSD